MSDQAIAVMDEAIAKIEELREERDRARREIAGLQGPPEVETYGDWLIWYAPPPIATRNSDWHFAHKDFDGDDCDARSGNEASREKCIEVIGFIEDMDAQEADDDRDDAVVHRALVRMREIILLKSAPLIIRNLLALPRSGNRGSMAGVHLNAARTWLADYDTHEKPLAKVTAA